VGDFRDAVVLTDVASCAAAADTGTVPGVDAATRGFELPSPAHEALGAPSVGGQLRGIDAAVDAYAGPQTYDGAAAGLTSVTTSADAATPDTQWTTGDGSTVQVVVRPDGSGRLSALHLVAQEQSNAATGPRLDVTLEWTCAVTPGTP